MLNEEIYNKFIADGDYAGAANYLSRGHFKDPNKQRIVNETIKQLRSEGRKIQGMMERADVDQKAAFSFINSIDNNSNLPGLNNGKDADGNYIGATNQYSKAYSDAKRNLASTNEHEAESISVKFGGKTDKRYGFLGIDFLAKDKEYKTDAFTEMLHRAGITKKSLINSGAKITVKDGQYYLNISKRNTLFNRVYNALLKTKSDDGLYRFQVAGIDAKGNLIKNNESRLMLSAKDRGEAIQKGIDISPYKTSDIEKGDGYYYNPSDSKMFRNFTAPFEVVNDANDKIKSITSTNEKEETSTVSSMTLNFNSARAKDISDYLNAGRINSSQASALIKENNNAILNGIMNSDLTQYEVYATDHEDDSGNTTRSKIDDTKTRAEIQDRIRAEIRDGKFDVNTQVALAIQGDQTGYVITLPAKHDKDGEVEGTTESIFIPNFLNGEAEKVFNRNTKTRAIKELASMEMYNYGVDIPQDGKLNVYNNPDTGAAVYQMEYSDGSTVQISKDEALRNINKMLIIEDGIDNANSLFYDEDGNIRKGIKQNGKINANFHNDLVKKIDAYVTSAMSELYPEAWQSFKPFASYAVNRDFESEDYKTKLAKAMESFIDSSNINLINNQRAIYSSYILDNIGMNDSDMYNIE
ncbi:MAG: hypothetical protein PUJ60_02195 [bacterium]|nr:hypothetical protein [bacterium]MDY4108962.1 hypothetical protein [Bacilli bacterium]